MVRLLMLVALMAGITACTLPQSPDPDVVPNTPPVTQAHLDVMRQHIEGLQRQVESLDARLSNLEPLTARMARLEALGLTTTTSRKGKGGRQTQELKPTQLISLAQQNARVEPSETGFWGRSGEQAYVWQPGRIYNIYLTSTHATGIFLPPGEQLAIGLNLDEKLYDVITKRAGSDIMAYDTISIHPLFDKGSAEGFLLTKSGRRYLLHFIIGEVGMIGVTFETPAITHDTQAEPKLILPRPQQ